MKSLYLFALFKIRPYKQGRRPLQGWRPGAMAPLPPLATPLGLGAINGMVLIPISFLYKHTSFGDVRYDFGVLGL